MRTPTHKRDEAQRELGQVGKTNGNQHSHSSAQPDLFHESTPDVAPRTPPIVTGQCAQVLNLIREHGPILSFEMTANCAIPEAAARVHDLRAAGYNIITTILAEVEFRGTVRRKAAKYSLGTPEWPAPGFMSEGGSI